MKICYKLIKSRYGNTSDLSFLNCILNLGEMNRFFVFRNEYFTKFYREVNIFSILEEKEWEKEF